MLALPSARDLLEHVKAIFERGCAHQPPLDQTDWTNFVASEMRALAAKTAPMELTCWGSPWSADDCGQHLVDVAWAYLPPGRNSPWTEYEGLALAMECEWKTDRDCLFQDFLKVLDVQADRRLFVGQLSAGGWHERQHLLDEFDAIVQRHRHLPDGTEIGIVLCSTNHNENGEGWLLVRGAKRELVWT